MPSTRQLNASEPLPTGDLPAQVAEAYLQALAEGWLPIEYCDACGTRQWYPRGFCTSCLSPAVSLKPAEGSGVLYTYSVVHRPPTEQFAPFVPYVFALVDLDEGVRVATWIVNSEEESLKIGMPLRLAFVDGPNGQKLPVFEPRSS